MGMVKNEWMEAQERGYCDLEGDVCIHCMDDEDLRVLHREHQTGLGTCEFCEKENVEVAPAEVIQERIMNTLGKYYVDIQYSGSPYISREGGWLISNDDASTIVDNYLACNVSDEFCNAVVNATMDELWCESNWDILSPLKKLKYGWEEFRHIVKHVQRFSFAWSNDGEEVWHPDHTNPRVTLERVGELVKKYKLLKTVPAGTQICRVRVDKNTFYSSMPDIGVPPSSASNASRMSPAGISMFYGAVDFETAIKETWDEQNTAHCSMGLFRLKKNISVVDYSSIPVVPGFWSDIERQKREEILFLHQLADDFSKPISRGAKVDLEYAPTQIVAEFLMKSPFLQTDRTNPITGLLFSSSKTGKQNFVLNLVHSTDSKLGNKQDDFLDLIQVSTKVLIP